jgi:hypothetical protein
VVHCKKIYEEKEEKNAPSLGAIQLYKIYVLPFLEFAYPIFKPILKKDKKRKNSENIHSNSIYMRSNPAKGFQECKEEVDSAWKGYWIRRWTKTSSSVRASKRVGNRVFV